MTSGVGVRSGVGVSVGVRGSLVCGGGVLVCSAVAVLWDSAELLELDVAVTVVCGVALAFPDCEVVPFAAPPPPPPPLPLPPLPPLPGPLPGPLPPLPGHWPPPVPFEAPPATMAHTSPLSLPT